MSNENGPTQSEVAAATTKEAAKKKKRNRTGEWKLECDVEKTNELADGTFEPHNAVTPVWEDRFEAVALSTEIRSLEQARARVRKIEEDRTDGIRRRYRVIVEKAILEPKVQTKQVCMFD